MSIASILDKLVFGPLLLLFDFILSGARSTITGNAIVLMAILSLAINLLVLLLWRQAEARREELRRKPGAASGALGAIGRAFLDSLPVLVDIPFLIVAYRYFTRMKILNGLPCGPIADMGAPDALARLSGHTVNLLPVALTCVGLLAAFIYTWGRPLKDKLICYLKVAVCLPLLYRSPASLTVYWTVNNLLWLCVVTLYRIARPERAVATLCSALGAAMLGFILLKTHSTLSIIRTILVGAGVLLQLPLCLSLARKRPCPAFKGRETQGDRLLFYAGCTFLTLFVGALIPLNVIQSSPEEFVDISNFHTSLRYVAFSLALAAGTFLLWPSIGYHLSSKGARRYWGLAMCFLSVIAVVDYLFFGNGYGLISSEFIYESRLVLLDKQILFNLLVVAAVAGLVTLAWKKGADILRAAGFAACLAVLVMSVFGATSIQNSYRKLLSNTQVRMEEQEIRFPLDKSGKNVMVIMLDRGMGRFIPYIMAEKPELMERFDGFTYYGNTLSYGSHTNVGAPGLFGGYEYIPLEMCKRSDELLVDKHNEALRLMPVLFLENGYDVTVCDPPYANYKQVPDLSIYDEWPEINTYLTMTDDAIEDREMLQHCDEVRERNLFCYSFFRASPLLLHRVLYDNGQYNDIDASWTQVSAGLAKARGISYNFMKSYSVLLNLPEYTSVRDEGKGTFMMMDNTTTHRPMLLQEPDYTPEMVVDNTAFEGKGPITRQSLDGDTLVMTTTNQVEHYHANMVTMLKLADWFDYLRANGVYDNTRIILVSDHAFRMDGLFDLRLAPVNNQDMHYFCPLLMVKDFDSTGFTVDSDTFMTNADTPLLALDSLVEDPVNPFTGNALSDAAKYLPEQQVAHEENVRPYNNNGTTFEGLHWFGNRNSIYDLSSWRYIGTEPEM